MTQNDSKFLVQKIRAEYAGKQPTELEALMALDAKVKRPANVFGYVYGSLGTIIMGAGMSLVMTDIGAVMGIANGMVPGILTGIAGLAMALTAYPIYKRILTGRKKKYAPQILALSEKLMEN